MWGLGWSGGRLAGVASGAVGVEMGGLFGSGWVGVGVRGLGVDMAGGKGKGEGSLGSEGGWDTEVDGGVGREGHGS